MAVFSTETEINSTIRLLQLIHIHKREQTKDENERRLDGLHWITNASTM
jgi:hypothetical protein